MTLMLESIDVDGLGLGSRDGFAAGHLQVDAAALARDLVEREPVLDTVRVHAVLPGESVRIHCCKDVVQPTVKVSGGRWSSSAAMGELRPI